MVDDVSKKFSNLSDFQLRVIEEKKELDTKIEKLTAFINSETYQRIEEGERYRLREQRSAMLEYSRVLGERIENFL